ncbi:hypothetical protein ACMUMQ_07995 [Marinomonas sp. 2405UD66-6]|uniref:hypothetical protein n=1 Tax=Marinomonas sp. 2405UD66-6 TaxID=3391834 RepID=UPI0039C9C0BB
MYNFDPNDLTKEKSIFDIFKKTIKIRVSKFHKLIIISIFIISSLGSYFLKITPDQIRHLSEIGFNFGMTTLGFLIAGFTIFTTLAKPEMMLSMMNHQNEKYKIPTLKYNLFVFMKVFIHFIFFTFLYLSVIAFGQSGGLVSKLIFIITPYISKNIILCILYTIIVCSLFHLLLSLKTFIFNTYAIVMSTLRWEYHISSTTKKTDEK